MKFLTSFLLGFLGIFSFSLGIGSNNIIIFSLLCGLGIIFMSAPFFLMDKNKESNKKGSQEKWVQ